MSKIVFVARFYKNFVHSGGVVGVETKTFYALEDAQRFVDTICQNYAYTVEETGEEVYFSSVYHNNDPRWGERAAELDYYWSARITQIEID